MPVNLKRVDVITLFVDDLPLAKRTAAFADPGGHIWELAQDLPRAEGP